MKIRTKLRWTAVCLIGITLVVGLVLFFMAGRIDQSLEEGESARQIVKGTFELNLITYDYLLHPGERTLKQWELKHNSLSKVLSNAGFSGDKLPVRKRITENHEVIKDLFNQMAAKDKQAGPAGAQSLLSREAKEGIAAQLVARTQMMLNDASFLRNKSDQDIARTKERATLYVIVSFLAMIVIVVSTALLLSRGIGGVLRRLEEGIKIIAGGNLDHKLPIDGNDETGALARAFNEMTGRLKTSYASIDDLKRAEEETQRLLNAVQQERDRLSALVNSIQDEVWFADTEKHFTLANPSALREFGINGATEIDIRKFAEALEVYRPDGVPRSPDEAPPLLALRGNVVRNLEEVVRTPVSGELRYRQVSAAPVRDGAGKIIGSVSVVHDITDHKRADEALQQRTLELQQLTETLEKRVEERTAELAELSNQMVSAQENERKRISYDLHDNVWQTLEIVRFQIENLFSRQNEAEWTTFRQISIQLIPLIRNMVGRIRTMQGDLWPFILDDIGIEATLEWYCRELNADHPALRFEKQVEVLKDDVPASVKIVIYRVMQEALANVIKHSRANRVSLSLTKNNNHLEFTVRDDGVGFDMEEAIAGRAPWGGLGLLNIKARTELSGGSFEVESAKGKGTTVRTSWPLGGSI